MTKSASVAEHEQMSLEDYAALWGCDPCYDHAPRLPGDGYLFYNFAVEGNDKGFLAKFLPAVLRTIEEVKGRETKNGKGQFDYTASEKRSDIPGRPSAKNADGIPRGVPPA